MSSLTLSLAIGALVIFALFAVNAVFYRMRRGTFLPRSESKESPLKQRLSGRDVLLALLFVLALFAGHAAPFFDPASPFARWLQEPYSTVVYAAWCLISITLVNVAVEVWRYFKTRKRGGA